MKKKINKWLFVCAVTLVLSSILFFFPKDDTSCGALAHGKNACSTHRCMGVFINSSGMTMIHHDCFGFDLGYVHDL